MRGGVLDVNLSRLCEIRDFRYDVLILPNFQQAKTLFMIFFTQKQTYIFVWFLFILKYNFYYFPNYDRK